MQDNQPRFHAGTIGVLAASLALASLVGCATARPAGEQFDDAVLTSKVQSRIAADPDLNPFEIHVDTRDRVVHLTGNVESEADREEAERHARATKGVSDVRNDIGIGDPTLGENVKDGWIVTKIKAKLAADPDINPFNIDVDVAQGVVTLSGTVAKERARTEAENLAQATDGVKSVHNRIEVKRAG